MSAAGVRMGRAFVEVGADDAGLKGVLTRAEAKLAAFGAAMQNVGKRMAGVGLAMAVPLGLATKVYADFESALARTRGLLGLEKTDEAFQSLTAEAKRLGIETVFSAGEAAQAMSVFAQNGLAANEILLATGPALNLATAGNLQLAEAADIATKTMRGLALPASEMTRIADVLALAAARANTDVRMLGEAMKYVGPSAVGAGISLEEIVAAIQDLSDAGIQADMAGTTLRGAIKSLVDPSAEGKRALATLGVTVRDAAGNFRPFADIIADLEAGLNRMPGNVDRLAAISQIFDARQAAGISRLTTTDDQGVSGADRLRKKTAQNLGAAGFGSKLAATQLDTLVGAWKLLTSSVEGAALVIGQALAPALRDLGQMLTDATNWTIMALEKNKEWIPVLGKVAGGLIVVGSALIVVGSATNVLAFGIGGLTKLWAGLGVVAGAAGSMMQLALLPITGLVHAASAAFGILRVVSLAALSPIAPLASVAAGGLGLLAGAFNGLTWAVNLLKVGTIALFSPVKTATAAFSALYAAAASSLAAAAAPTSALSASLTAVATAARASMSAVLGFIPAVVGAVGVIGLIGGAILGLTVVWGIFTTDGQEAFAWLGGQIVDAVGGAISLVQDLVAGGVAMMSSAFTGFGTAIGRVWDATIGGASLVWKGFEGLLVGGVALVQSAWGGVANFFGGIWTNIKAAAGSFLTWLTDGFRDLGAFFGTVWSSMFEFIKAGDFSKAAKVAWLGVKAVFVGMIGQFETAWIGFTQFFQSLWGSALAGLSKLFAGVWYGISVAWVETVGVMSRTWDGFQNLVGEGKKVWNKVEFDMKMNVIKQELEGKKITPEEATLRAMELHRSKNKVEFEINEQAAARTKAAEELREKQYGQINEAHKKSEDRINAEMKKAEEARRKVREASESKINAEIEAAAKELADAMANLERLRGQVNDDVMEAWLGKVPEPGKPQRPGIPSPDQVMQMITGPSYGTFSAEALNAVLGQGDPVAVAIARTQADLLRQALDELRIANDRLGDINTGLQ